MNFRKFLISEGIEDKGIFKAIFMAGSPGAGKSYVIKKVQSGTIAPRIVNRDKYLEFLGGEKIPYYKDPNDPSKGINMEYVQVKDKSKILTLSELTLYVNSMLPLWIDGTSSSVARIIRRKSIIESFGYDTGLLFVNVDLDVALKRAGKRKRFIDPDFIKEAYRSLQKIKRQLQGLFEWNFEVNNNEGELSNEVIMKGFKNTIGFFTAPIHSPIGKKFYNKLRLEKEKYLVPTIFPNLKTIKSIIYKW